MSWSRWRDRSWWPASTAMAVSTAALAAALLIPNLFSDPNGIDPHALRLAAVAVVLAVTALTSARLVRTRPIVLAMFSIVAGYCVWSVAPDPAVVILGVRAPSFGVAILVGAALQLAVTLAVMVAVRHIDRDVRLRLTLPQLGGVIATIAGIAGLALLVFLLPAQLLGREGIALIAVERNVPLLASDILQGSAQELQFRGLLLGALEPVMSPRIANAVQAVFFGLAHLAVAYQGPLGPFVPVAIAFGWALGWLTQKTGSVWPAVVIHAVADAGVDALVLPGLYGH